MKTRKAKNPALNGQEVTVLQQKFRFPITQIGPLTVEVEIPLDIAGLQVLTTDFIEEFKLTDREIEECTTAILTEIAIVK